MSLDSPADLLLSKQITHFEILHGEPGCLVLAGHRQVVFFIQLLPGWSSNENKLLLKHCTYYL